MSRTVAFCLALALSAFGTHVARSEDDGEARMRIHLMTGPAYRQTSDRPNRWRYGGGLKALLGTRTDDGRDRTLVWGVLAGFRVLAFKEPKASDDARWVGESAYAYDLGIAFESIYWNSEGKGLRAGGIIIGLNVGPTFFPGVRALELDGSSTAAPDKVVTTDDSRRYGFGLGTGVRAGYATPRGPRCSSFTVQLAVDLRALARNGVELEPQLLFGFAVN